MDHDNLRKRSGRAMRIVIFGAGGIGGVLGARLLSAGLDVVFIARGSHLEAMKQRGLRLESRSREIVFSSVVATDAPAEVGVADVIFVCVKAWEVEKSICLLRLMLGPDTIVIPLQNWVEAADILASRLGGGHVLGGICHSRSQLVAPGVIQSSGDTMEITLGELAGGCAVAAGALQKFAGAPPGLRFKTKTNIKRHMWIKFMWVSSFGAIGSLTKASLGEWRKNPQMRSLCKILLREAGAVAKASGVPLGWWMPFRFARSITKGDPGYKSSMQLDHEAGRRSELPYQLGTIVSLGRALGVSVARSSEVYERLMALEETSPNRP
jgi:2-dehydropantoate 2-reductase